MVLKSRPVVTMAGIDQILEGRMAEWLRSRVIPGTLAKGLAGAHFGEKDQMKLKNETVG